MAVELWCNNLHAGYARNEVLRGLSCCFSASRLSCILGPNGAGKTTLLRAALGLLPLRSGNVTLDGVDLSQLKPRERARRIALVPQLAAEAVPLTVREAVALAQYARRGATALDEAQAEPAVTAALEALALTPLADQPCAAISGGEWRRVLIAQGLAQQAEALLLDEPTAFLDPPARSYIMAKLRELAHAYGLIIAVVLHDPDLALRFADDVVLVRDGMVQAAGPAGEVLREAELEQLYDSPAHVPATKEEK
jgi:iron complex transport system ATP-binding protein